MNLHSSSKFLFYGRFFIRQVRNSWSTLIAGRHAAVGHGTVLFRCRVIDVGSEWRTFNNEKDSKDNSRVGAAEVR